jgi:peroxiredoxin
MRKSKHQLISLILSVTFFATMLPTTATCAISKPTIAAGMLFPEFSLRTPADPEAINYLGLINTAKTFSTNQINSSVLLVEFFNAHCPHCQEQAPIYNLLYDKIVDCGADCAQIKMIAIGVGNSTTETEQFRHSHEIRYPVFSDSNFTTWQAVGGKSAPLTVIIHQTGQHELGVVFSTHLGINKSYRHVYAELIDALEISDHELHELVELAKTNMPAPLAPGSSQALKKEVFAGLRQLGRVTGLKKIELTEHDNVYTALIHKDRKSRRLFAQIIERATACDICHDVKFICVFDTAGTIVDIVPLHLTKFGNKPWNADDIAKLKQRLLGRKLPDPQPFDAQVDAISSATISSAMIFDSIAEGKELYDALNLGKQEISDH